MTGGLNSAHPRAQEWAAAQQRRQLAENAENSIVNVENESQGRRVTVRLGGLEASGSRCPHCGLFNTEGLILFFFFQKKNCIDEMKLT